MIDFYKWLDVREGNMPEPASPYQPIDQMMANRTNQPITLQLLRGKGGLWEKTRDIGFTLKQLIQQSQNNQRLNAAFNKLYQYLQGAKPMMGEIEISCSRPGHPPRVGQPQQGQPQQ